MKILTRILREYPLYLIGLFIFAIALSFAIIIQNTTIAKIISELLIHHTVAPVFAILFIVLMMRMFCNFIMKQFGTRIAFLAKHQLRKKLIDAKGEVGTLMNAMNESMEQIDPFYSEYVPQVFKSMIVPMAILIFLLYFHIQTALIMLITSPFIPIFYIIIGINTEKKAQAQMLQLNQFSNYFLNTFKGIMTIKLFQYEKETLQKMEDYSERYKQDTLTILKTAFLSTLMIEFIAMLSIGIIALEVGFALIVFHSVSFYEAIVVLMLAPEFYNAVKALGMAFHTGKTASGYAEQLQQDYQLFNEQQTSLDNKQMNPNQKYQHHNDRENEIVFSNIQFQYANGFNMAINQSVPLQSYVITGQSGSGKSTFAKLISGIHQPNVGKIQMPKGYDGEVVYLDQHIHLFHDTVLNNITMYQQVDMQQLEAYAKKVNMHECILSLPNGYDTKISPNDFSGGEQKRLMLLRLLVLKKKLLIIDEPNAMLDVETEQLIRNVIEELKKNHIVWVIAHSKSYLSEGATVIHFENGQMCLKEVQHEVDR